jgi:hypothetical protein
MATRKLFLGSAAKLFVVGAICATPALAQQDSAQAYASARSQYEAQLQDYNQKQQAYEQQRSQYNTKVDQYQRALSGPARSSDTVVVVDDDDPDVVVVENPDAPDVVVARETDVFAQRLLIRDVPGLVRLEDVIDVNNRLFNAPMVDAAGIPVGHFRRVEIKETWGGNIAAVVTLNGSRRTISLLTEHVRLDPDRGVIIADLTARQIDRIPSGFPYG